ncbi:hypothetical protein SAMN05428975_1007 [Mucilaginibacter sp. OK268]|nr:hypothetical protein SAMN05428975_1007 [Mucilaginibacter sp. OK268]
MRPYRTPDRIDLSFQLNVLFSYLSFKPADIRFLTDI